MIAASVGEPAVRVAVIGGGASCEHEVSLASAAAVAAALDPAVYDVVRLTIGRDGCWSTAGSASPTRSRRCRAATW